MAQGKNQHYVPKSYFKAFSPDTNNICIYNLKREFFKFIPYKDQCSEDYFYSKNKEIEKVFSELEQLNLNNLEKIRANKSLLGFSDEEINHLKSHILFQYGRTKSIGDSHQEMATHLFDSLKSKIFQQSVYEGKELSKEDFEKIEIILENPVGTPLILSMLSGILLYDLNCVLLVNQTNIDFIFSDHPVILFNSFFNNKIHGGTTGYSVTGLQIFYPISSKLMIHLYDNNFYFMKNRKHEGRILISKRKDIQRLNGLQIINADENIYFENKKMLNNVVERYNQVKYTIPDSKTEKELIKIPKDDGPFREIIRTSSSKYGYDLKKLSFLSHKDTKLPFGIRNLELNKLHSKFVNAVFDGKIRSINDLDKHFDETPLI